MELFPSKKKKKKKRYIREHFMGKELGTGAFS